MDFQLLIIIGGALLLIFLVIKLFSKTMFRIIGIALVAIALGIYIFKVRSASPDSKLSVINTLSLDEIEKAYCENPVSKDDSVKCNCIVAPICADMKQRFSPEQLNEMKTKKVKFIAELILSANNRRAEIIEKLKKNKAEHLLDQFIDDIKSEKIFSHKVPKDTTDIDT